MRALRKGSRRAGFLTILASVPSSVSLRMAPGWGAKKMSIVRSDPRTARFGMTCPKGERSSWKRRLLNWSKGLVGMIDRSFGYSEKYYI